MKRALSFCAAGAALLTAACGGSAPPPPQIPTIVADVAELECRSGGPMQLYVAASNTVTGGDFQGTAAAPRGLLEARLWVVPVEGSQSRLEPGRCKMLVDDSLLFSQLFNRPGNRANNDMMKLNIKVDPYEINGGAGGGSASVAISYRDEGEVVTQINGVPATFEQVKQMVTEPGRYRVPLDYSDRDRLVIGPPRRID